MKKHLSTMIFVMFLTVPLGNSAPQNPKPEPDVIILVDGERLIGHLDHSVGSSLVFKSDLAGEVTLDWSKVKEFHSSSKFAVIPKGEKVHGRAGKTDQAKIPQGTLNVADQKLEITPNPQSPPQTVPVTGTAYVIDENTFLKNVVSKPGFTQDWTGSATVGATFVQATQDSRSFASAVSLIRAVPGEEWLDQQSRTIVDFTASYGEVTQPSTPTVKTNIIHGGLEHDIYFSPRLFGYVSGAWDHNFSQGLDLQQTYGGGVGFTAIKNDREELDFKAGADYIRQQFAIAASNQNLIGSTFGESYTRKFPRSIVWTESLTVIPAWNNTRAYSAVGNTNLALPLYKSFNVTFGVLDNFLNDPPPGFKKNSLQFQTGLTFAIQ